MAITLILSPMLSQGVELDSGHCEMMQAMDMTEQAVDIDCCDEPCTCEQSLLISISVITAAEDISDVQQRSQLIWGYIPKLSPPKQRKILRPPSALI